MHTSVVWLLARKLNAQEAQCNLCSKVIKFCGTPTNVRRHLVSKHPLALARVETDAPELAESDDAAQELLEIATVHSTSDLVEEIEVVNRGKKRQHEKGIAKFFKQNNKLRTRQVAAESQVRENENNFSHLQSTSQGMPLMLDQLLPSTSSTTSHPFMLMVPPLLSNPTSKTRSGETNTRITESLVNLIVKNCLPFSTVETEAFQLFLQLLCPHYEIPSATTIRNYIDRKYKALFEVTKNALQSVENFALTVDIWANLQTSSMIGVTAHYIDGRGDLNFVTLGLMETTEYDTSDIIADCIRKILDKWAIELEQITAITTDDSENIVAAVHSLLNDARHIDCFAHTLSSILGTGFEEKSTAEIVQSIERIVTWLDISSSITDDEREAIKELCQTLSYFTQCKWNSISSMLRKFLQLKDTVSNILQSHESTPTMVDGDTIAVIEDILPVLSLFDDVTKDCSREEAAFIGRIVPICDFMLSKFQTMVMKTNVGKNFLNTIENEFAKRSEYFESHYIFGISSLLDPRYKKLHFRNAVNCSNALARLTSLLKTFNDATKVATKIVHEPQEETQLSELDNFTVTKAQSVVVTKPSEMLDYLKSPTVDVSVQPLKYWWINRHEYPQLYKVVKKFMCVRGSSTPNERLLSISHYIKNARWNKVNTDVLERLLYLKYFENEWWES